MPADLELFLDGPADTPMTVVLAHGAGVGMDAPFMNAFAAGIARSGYRVVRFEFAYMADCRKTGKKRPPDHEPVLRIPGCESWRSWVRSVW